MYIRKALLKDSVVISAIAKKVWPVAYKNILTQEQMEYMLQMMYSTQALHRQMREAGHVFYLAVIDNSCVGFISFEISYMPGQTKIHKLYVLPDIQTKGIGTALIEYAGNIATAQNNTHLILNVNRYNNAVYFYKKNDFTIIGSEDIDIGNGYLMEDYIMKKQL
ncbi:GNAT family N-acetyltransferase [Flavobacterium rhizosphaerae]|uniref:GNAT family N-acetyltransferase n=1 Tax=Flavobacterium rhizosphaerae TaxID=3163298 RepID=A0ABW8YXX3_9FLAO